MVKGSNDTRRAAFVKAITAEVSKMIANKYHMSVEQAMKDFKNTKTYNFLAYSDDPFVEDDPDDFFELYRNEKNMGG